MFHGNTRHSGVGTGDISDSPKFLWNYTINEPIVSMGYSPTIANGMIYEFFGNGNKTSLHALNLTTGAKIWNYSLGNPGSWSPAIANGILYTGCYDHYLYAIDANSGELIWKYDIIPSTNNTIVCSSPTVSDEVVYFGYGLSGMSTNALVAVNATTGSKIWNYSITKSILSVPAVVDGVAYVGVNNMGGGSADVGVLAVNATTGTLLWTFYELNLSITSSPAVINGLLYIGSSTTSSITSKLYALNAHTGQLVWSQDIPSQTNSSPAVANNMVYIGSTNGTIYAFNAQTGAQVWSYKTGNGISSSPAISDGTVVIGSGDGNLYAFDAVTGNNTWKYEADGQIFCSPAVQDGKIYFVTSNYTSRFVGMSYVYTGYCSLYALNAAHPIKTDLTASCISSTSYNSFHVTINGTFTVNNTGSSSAPIQIAYSNNGGANWQNLTQVTHQCGRKIHRRMAPNSQRKLYHKSNLQRKPHPRHRKHHPQPSRTATPTRKHKRRLLSNIKLYNNRFSIQLHKQTTDLFSKRHNKHNRLHRHTHPQITNQRHLNTNNTCR